MNVANDAISPEVREKTAVTVVMRGIYITYLAVKHSDLLISCLFHTRQVCLCCNLYVQTIRAKPHGSDCVCIEVHIGALSIGGV